ncbi:MAG: hypothetical protein D6689_20450 [Deltaproteobacteria bacterium]|nr:MAG: hypothetical protein D6689_20450 [Deltaproteobacteria bacterium]
MPLTKWTRLGWFSTIAFSLALAAGACGGGDDDDDTTADAAPGADATPGADAATPDAGTPDARTSYTNLDDLARDYSAVLCDKLAECVPVFDIFASPLECSSLFYGRELAAAIDRWQKEIDAGELTFDGDKAAECLAALRAADCSRIDVEDLDPRQLSPACGEMLTGNRGDGDACTDSVYCAPQLYCDTSSACPGTCAAPIAVGETCVSGQRCAAGAVCFVPESGGDGTCTMPVGDGEACDVETGPPCAPSSECDTGSAGGTAGTCAPQVNIPLTADDGEACGPASGALCKPGLTCALATPSSGTCRPDGIQQGQQCPPALPDACAPGLYCDGAGIDETTGAPVSGTCKPIPDEGKACAEPPALLPDGPHEDGLCTADTYCDRTASPPTCVAPTKANGAACLAHGVCASGYCGDIGYDSDPPTPGTCQDPVDLCD